MATSTNTSAWTQYEAAHHVSFVYLIIIGTLGIVSNSLVIIVLIQHDKLRTATNLFILNLALCDLIISVLDSALSIPSTYSRRWMFGTPACICYGFVHYFFISVTVSTLAAISIDRFFYITKPAQVKAWRITKTRAMAMLCIIYIYVLLFTFPPLPGWNSFITEEQFFSGCYIHYSDQDPASIGYSVIASTFLFLVPLLVMIYCYAKIYTAVRTSTQKTITRALGPLGNSIIRRKYPLFKRTHVQTAKMIIVVIFFSVIVWLPFVVVSLIKAFTGNTIISPLASHITILITKSCVVYNVLIYVVLNRKLKAAILDLICCGRLPDCLSKTNKPSSSKMRISRMLSETDKDIPSDIARNRLNAIAALMEQGKESGSSSNVPTPILQKEKGIVNAGLRRESPTSSMLKNGKVKTPDLTISIDSIKSSSLSSSRIVVFEDRLQGADTTSKSPGNAFPQRRSSQVDSDSSENKILSFSSLEDEKKTPQRSQLPVLANSGSVNRVREARRRALRKMNQREGSRKLPTLPAKAESRKADTQVSQTTNNNNKSNNKNVVHSQENSSSTATPSSNTSTLSEASLNTTVKDDSSIDVSPRSVSSTQRHLPRKSKTMGYRGGRNALLRERLKHANKDPLHVSPSELAEIQSYWKRMSLCLDEIDIDEEV